MPYLLAPNESTLGLSASLASKFAYLICALISPSSQLINLRNLEAKQKIVAEVDLMRKLVNINIINTIPTFKSVIQQHHLNHRSS